MIYYFSATGNSRHVANRLAESLNESVLTLLYEAYADCNKMDDGTIKEDFDELYRLMNGMALREIDKIIYPVCTLCRDHQKSGFVDGIKVGIQLQKELK